MKEFYDYEENGGIFYMVLSLLIFAVYLEFFVPLLNEADYYFVKRYARNELLTILSIPFIVGGNFMALQLMSWTFGFRSAHGIMLNYFVCLIFLLVIFHSPIFVLQPQILDPDSDPERRPGPPIVPILIGYICCHLSLFLFLFGIFGPFEFEYDMENLTPAKDILYKMDKNGGFKMVNMAHGYLTYVLYHYTPEWLLFGVVLYVHLIRLMATIRLVVLFIYFLLALVIAGVIYLWNLVKSWF